MRCAVKAPSITRWQVCHHASAVHLDDHIGGPLRHTNDAGQMVFTRQIGHWRFRAVQIVRP